MLASSRGPRAAANAPGRIRNPPLRTTDNTQQPRPPAPPRLRFSAFLGYNNRETVIIQILRSGSPLWLTPARQPPFDAQLYHSAARHGIIAAVNGCGVLKASASARRGTSPRPARQDGVIQFGNKPVYYTNRNCCNRPFSHFCALQLQNERAGDCATDRGFLPAASSAAGRCAAGGAVGARARLGGV